MMAVATETAPVRPGLSAQELERFVGELAATPERWAGFIRTASDARTYELIHDDGVVNAWLICWSRDADTGFHDHDDSAAAIRVVSGHVREGRICLSGASRERVLGPWVTPEGELQRISQGGEQELREPQEVTT